MTINMVYLCPECGKSFASTSGLGGHRRWLHGIPGRKPRRQALFVTTADILRGFNCLVAEDEKLRDLSDKESAWLYEAYKAGRLIGERFAALDEKVEKVEGLALEVARLSEEVDQLRAKQTKVRKVRPELSKVG